MSKGLSRQQRILLAAVREHIDAAGEAVKWSRGKVSSGPGPEGVRQLRAVTIHQLVHAVFAQQTNWRWRGFGWWGDEQSEDGEEVVPVDCAEDGERRYFHQPGIVLNPGPSPFESTGPFSFSKARPYALRSGDMTLSTFRSWQRALQGLVRRGELVQFNTDWGLKHCARYATREEWEDYQAWWTPERKAEGERVMNTLLAQLRAG